MKYANTLFFSVLYFYVVFIPLVTYININIIYLIIVPSEHTHSLASIVSENVLRWQYEYCPYGKTLASFTIN